MTICLLKLANENPPICMETEDTQNCIKKLDEKGFFAYIQTHSRAQSLCHFYKTNLWTEKSFGILRELERTALSLNSLLY